MLTQRLATAITIIALFMIFFPGLSYSSPDAIPEEDGEWQKVYSVSASIPLAGDIQTAENYAILMASKRAVSTAVAQLLATTSIIQGSSQLEDFINESFGDYVKNYTVLSSGTTGDNYSVELDVIVRIGALSVDLYSMQVSFPKPRIMVIVSEQHALQATPYPNAESSIIQGLVDSGFDVVDQNQSALLRDDNNLKSALYGSADTLLKDSRLASQGSEILIIGEALSEYLDFSGGLYACRAKLSYKAIQNDTAKILVAGSCEASGKETSELLASASALKNTGDAALSSLIPKLLLKFNPNSPHSVTLRIYDIPFEDLVILEHDLDRYVPGVNTIYRRSYANKVAEIEVMYEGSAQNLSESFVLKPFTKYLFEIVEFTENSIDLKMTGINESYMPSSDNLASQPLLIEASPSMTPTGSTSTSEQSNETSAADDGVLDDDDEKIGLSILPFEDPYNTGLGEAAANALGEKLNDLRFFNCIAAKDIEAINQVVSQRVTWFDMDPAEFAVQGKQAGFDWLILGNINNVRFDMQYNEGVTSKDKYGKTYYVVQPGWDKKGAMEISIKLIDLRTYDVIYEESQASWDSQSAKTKDALRSDESMSNNMLNSALMDAYIGILEMCYDYFDLEGYIISKDPNQNDRAIISLTGKEGLQIEMSMVVYTAGEIITLPNGNDIVSWKELCKATVKEIHDREGYSVIEIEDKWFKWIECEEGKNKVVPVFLIKKSTKEDIWETIFG